MLFVRTKIGSSHGLCALSPLTVNYSILADRVLKNSQGQIFFNVDVIIFGPRYSKTCQ